MFLIEDRNSGCHSTKFHHPDHLALMICASPEQSVIKHVWN